MTIEERCNEEDIFYAVYYFNQSVLDVCNVLREFKPGWLERVKLLYKLNKG